MTKHLHKKPRASRSRDLRARTLRAHRASTTPPPPAAESAPVSTAPSEVEPPEDPISFPPPPAELDHEEPSPASSPAELRVPAQLPAQRKVLLGVVVAVGIVAGAIVGNVVVTRLRGTASPRAAAPTAPIARDPEPPSRPGIALPPPPPAAPAATAVEPAASASAYEPQEAPIDEARAKELRAQVLALLDHRKNAEAIPLARAAIDADPLDALGYLYLGSALQDSGKWKDAMDVYKECVRTARKGIVDECRAMVGRRGGE